MQSREYESPRRRIVAVLVLVAILMWLLYLLQPRPITFECTTLNQPSGPIAQAQVPAGQLPLAVTTANYVENQVIVIGPAPAIDRVVAELGLVPLKDCGLGYFSQFPDADETDPSYFPFPPDTLNTLTMRLYEIPADATRSIVDVVDTINQDGNASYVYADRNYLTGPLGASPCGEPYIIGGSPYIIGGSPYIIGGSPYIIGGSPYIIGGSPYIIGGSPYIIGGSPGAGMGLDADPNLFWPQWAFEHIGLTPPQSSQAYPAPNVRGKSVRVGIFDTSPYTVPVGGLSVQSVTWITPTFSLTISEVERSTLLPLSPLMVTDTDRLDATNVISDIRDHGLFVAGLIHAVAPDSDIHLIKVLDEHGCGDLFTLNDALNRFLAQALRERKTLRNTVLNLSLGILNKVEAPIQEPGTPVELPGPEEQTAQPAATGSVTSTQPVVIGAAQFQGAFGQVKTSGNQVTICGTSFTLAQNQIVTDSLAALNQPGVTGATFVVLDDGQALAANIRSAALGSGCLLDLEGVVQTKGDPANNRPWTIAGIDIAENASTAIEGQPQDGDIVRVSAEPNGTTFVALRIAEQKQDQDPVESLSAVLYRAYKANVVIVSAAGNDSGRVGAPQAPNIPAAYPFVLGVSGSNVQRQRACFSNWGDMVAPSGDGGPGELLSTDSLGQTTVLPIACAPKAAVCTGNCPDALISIATASATGYAYWSGTSFAAPLVSGLSALTLDAGVKTYSGGPPQAYRWVSLSPNETAQAMRCGAAMADGVINVPATLTRCIR